MCTLNDRVWTEAIWETQVQPWVGKIPPEKEMATHSSILAWEIPWTEEPGGLQSMGLQSWAWLNDQYTLGCKAFFLALCFEWDSFTPWVLGLVLCFKLKFTFWLPGLENFFLALFVKRGFSPRGLGWEFFPLGSFEASVFSFWFCFPEGSFSVSWSPLLGLIWLYVLLSSACFLAGMTLLTLIGASVGNWGSAQSCFSETSRFPLLPLILPHSAPSIFPSTPLNPLGLSSGPSILCPPCQTLFLLTLASQALGLVALCLLGLTGDSVMSNSLRPRGL